MDLDQVATAAHYGCTLDTHVWFGGGMWRLKNPAAVFSPSTILIADMVDAFVSFHPHKRDYTLAIYDYLTERAIEVPYELPMDLFGRLVEDVVHYEGAFPISFIGEFRASECFVIGMPLHRGRTTTRSLVPLVERLMAERG